MKKITESELKDRVARLKEKLVAEEQKVDEWSFLSPSSWFNGRDYGDSTSRDDVRTQDAAKNSAAGANMALVQNREQMVPGSTGSTEEGGITYAIDDAGNKLAKINPQTQKWEMMPQAAPTGSAALDGTKPGADPATTIPGGPDTAVGGATPGVVNRDNMSFSQAFAAARSAGEKQFTWKGKPYTTELAKPGAASGGQGGQPAQTISKPADPRDAEAGQSRGRPAAPAAPKTTQGATPTATAGAIPAVKESASLDEIDRLVSLVHYR